ncbi:MAG: hypothetical protein LRZ88_02155 [Candidatus Cloacimonetes bacterium]|nr:hypothetical protein [Candidatus Cloacimonadota bacterium]
MLSTEITPTYGQILVDGKNLYSNINYYLEYLGYVPQEDRLVSQYSAFMKTCIIA